MSKIVSSVGGFLGDIVDVSVDIGEVLAPSAIGFATGGPEGAAAAAAQQISSAGAGEAAQEAANAQIAAAERAGTITREQAAQARQDVLGFLPQAQQALTGAGTLAQQALAGGGAQAQEALIGGGAQARQALIAGGTEAGQTLAQAEQPAISALRSASTLGQQAIGRQTGFAIEDLSGFAGRGETAAARELALSGALGQEAFNQALLEDPAQAFIREEQEKAVLRASGATGGVGGGAVLEELQRRAAGRATLNIQQQIGNLGGIAQRGFGATSQTAGLRQAQGINIANILGQEGRGTADIITNIAGQRAGIQGQQGAGLANLFGQQGAGLANILGQQGVNIANLQQQQGINQANLLTGAGTTLSNIATGVGTPLANLALSGGTSQAAGILGQSAAQQQLLGGLAQTAGQFGLPTGQLPTGQTPGIIPNTGVNVQGQTLQPLF